MPPVRATPGRGQVTLDWDRVPGAVGYLVLRSHGAGPAAVVDHLGGDVLAVPGPPYADPSGTLGIPMTYGVIPVLDPDDVAVLVAGPPTIPPDRGAVAAPLAASAATVEVEVDVGRPVGPLRRPWRPMIGSEHLSLLTCTDHVGGVPVGPDLLAALNRVYRELGVERVRAHGILGDDLEVYREVDGHPVIDFTGIDRVVDLLLTTGLRPVLELSFMPRALALDPSAVITAAGVASPPRDPAPWRDLVRRLVRHVLARYGEAEVRRGWAAEVWNEPNLDVFWRADQAAYLELYAHTAAAVRDGCPWLPVGGPATAASGWIEPFLAATSAGGRPVDFVSTHAYGIPPLDLRPLLARHGVGRMPVWWTEWGPSPTHFHPVNDSVLSASFVATGMQTAARLDIDTLACWVASDQFEELGRPPRLLHGGFGLLSVGGLAKPRFWALWALEQLAPTEVAVRLDGDGAGSLVQVWASVDEVTGRVAVVLWNGTLHQGVLNRDAVGLAVLARTVQLRVHGLAAGGATLRHRRLDESHGNLAHTAQALGIGDWPDDDQWAALRAADRLPDLEPPRLVDPKGALELTVELPMPSLSLIELEPVP